MGLKLASVVLGIACMALGASVVVGVYDGCFNPATKIPECTGPVLGFMGAGGVVFLLGVYLLVGGLIETPRPRLGTPYPFPPPPPPRE